LISKYGKDDSLYPKDLQKRAVVDQRLHFDSSILFPRLRDIVVSSTQQMKNSGFSKVFFLKIIQNKAPIF
jgi:hypothetical protein